MPVLRGEHDGPTAIGSAVSLDGRFGFGVNLGLGQLAFAIHRVQIEGQLLSLFRILRQQELDPCLRGRQAASGIETGGQSKAHLPRSDILLRNVGDVFQRLHTKFLAAGQLLQAMLDQNTIFPLQGGDIGDRAQCHEVEVPAQIRGLAGPPRFLTQPSAQSHDQFEGDPHTSQFLGWIATLRLVRIQHSHRIRERRRHLMMIRDDHIHSQASGELDLMVTGDAAIDSDEEAGALIGKLPNRLGIEPIAFPHAMRQIVWDWHANVTEEPTQHRRRSDPIHIVIAVNDDGLLALYTPGQTVDSLCHAAHEKWIVEAL
jgi:hypothetical protein